MDYIILRGTRKVPGTHSATVIYFCSVESRDDHHTDASASCKTSNRRHFHSEKVPVSPPVSQLQQQVEAGSSAELTRAASTQAWKDFISGEHRSSTKLFCFQQAIMTVSSVMQVTSGDKKVVCWFVYLMFGGCIYYALALLLPPFFGLRFPTWSFTTRGMLGFRTGFPFCLLTSLLTFSWSWTPLSAAMLVLKFLPTLAEVVLKAAEMSEGLREPKEGDKPGQTGARTSSAGVDQCAAMLCRKTHFSVAKLT